MNRDFRYKRIYIVGPSGVGKTKLAKILSEELDIPFITTSTKPLWDNLGITSHQELIKYSMEKPENGHNFQLDVLAYRDKIIQANDEFITDRSPIDNLVYYYLQCSPVVTNEMQGEFEQAALAQLLKHVDAVIFLPFTNNQPWVEDDGARIVNRRYQTIVSDLFESVLKTIHTIPIINLRMWDLETRIRRALLFITNNPAIYNINTEKILEEYERKKADSSSTK